MYIRLYKGRGHTTFRFILDVFPEKGSLSGTGGYIFKFKRRKKENNKYVNAAQTNGTFLFFIFLLFFTLEKRKTGKR